MVAVLEGSWHAHGVTLGPKESDGVETVKLGKLLPKTCRQLVLLSTCSMSVHQPMLEVVFTAFPTP